MFCLNTHTKKLQELLVLNSSAIS